MMQSPSRRTVRNAVIASTAALALALTACSSDSGSSNADGSATENTDGRGPITFAMGKNDTDKIQPIIQKWERGAPRGESHPRRARR